MSSAKKPPSESEASVTKKFENVTLRATPSQKFTLDVLSRLRKASLSDTLQELVRERLHQEIQTLRASDLDDPRQALGEILHKAWWAPHDMRPHERLIALYAVCPDLLTSSEVETIKLLQDLGAIACERTAVESFDEGLGGAAWAWRYEFDPFVVNLVWHKASEVASLERPSVTTVAVLAKEIADARELKGV